MDADYTYPAAPKKLEKTWPEWCYTMSAFMDGVGRRLKFSEAVGRAPEGGMPEYDWLAVAVGNLGGIELAAEKLGVSRQTIYGWLGKGLAKIDFQDVAKLARESHIPMELLAQRLGPWKDTK